MACIAIHCVHIMSRSDERVLRAVISAGLEKLHRNPRTARGGPLFGEVIPATRNNLVAAEAYYYSHSPADSLFQVRFQIYCSPHFAGKIRDSSALKSGCLKSYEISRSRKLSINILKGTLKM